MPLVKQENINAHGLLGIWEITESVEDLLSMIRFTNGEKEIFEKFKNKSRQAHWLSYRLAIRKLLGNEDYEFYYDEFGKLHFANGKYFLSVSHSGDYSAVIISRKHTVGIDIEKITPRILGLEQKFMNEYELSNLSESGDVVEKLTAIWGAKESLYKLYGKRDLAFDKDISIDATHFYNKGKMMGTISREGFHRDYKLVFEKFNGYSLVYAIDQ